MVCLFASIVLVAAIWKTTTVLALAVPEYGLKDPQGHRDVRCVRRNMGQPDSHVIVVLRRKRKEHDSFNPPRYVCFYPTSCDGIYHTSSDGIYPTSCGGTLL